MFGGTAISDLFGAVDLGSRRAAESCWRWPSLQQKPTHLTSAFTGCHDSLQTSRQERKLLPQVCVLRAKHFHLCNKIAEASRGSSRQPCRTLKDLEEHKMVDGQCH